MKKKTESFRLDINGLRAWAVAAVMLYHFGVPGFHGGFIGVDVFFVISGFLMTGIVIQRLEQGSFSLLDFYMARAKRILPALMGVCAALIALGWIWLLPPDYKTMCAHALYSLAFVSNVIYLREAGYFDLASHDKWLLHTWSLSVEWQFYLVLPLVLWAVWRWRPGRGAQGWVLAAVLGSSLAASAIVTASNPSAAFFLLPMRAWEMLAGGLVFLLGARLAQRRWLGAAGLAAIALSIVLFDSTTPWPGWRALLPVLGTAMVIASHGNAYATNNALAQWLGTRSYSLYLWHWPVYVALAYAGLQREPVAAGAGLALTLVLGDLSYRWLENPARQALGRHTSWRGAGILAGLALLIALPGGAMWRLNGVPGRFAQPVLTAAGEAANFNPRRGECHQRKGVTSPSCLYGGTAPGIIILGDSHASALVTAVAGSHPDVGVLQWTYDACVYLPGMRKANPHQFNQGADCSGFNAWVQQQLQAVPPDVPVVLIGRYARYAFGALEDPRAGAPEVYFGDHAAQAATPEFLAEFGAAVTRSACELAATRPVYMVRPIPEMPANAPQYIARRLAWGADSTLSVPLEQYRRRNGWLWAAQDAARDRCGVHILDPLPALCDAGHCYASRAQRPLYYDHGHLSEYGNEVLQPIFASIAAGAPRSTSLP